jgi:4-hydroxybenzoate polyprenyltransferase
MVDRDDDIKIGIKTTALLFGRFDVAAVVCSHALFLGLMLLIGLHLGMGIVFIIAVAVAAEAVWMQYKLIKHRERDKCFTAFLQNNWLGAWIFFGIVADYALR